MAAHLFEDYVYTDTGGRYVLRNVEPGEHDIRPRKAGLDFQPAVQRVTVGPGGAEADFAAKIHKPGDGIVTTRAVLVGVNDYGGLEEYLWCSSGSVRVLRDTLLRCTTWESGSCQTLVDVWDTDVHPSKGTVREAVRRAGEASDQDDILLFYFAGHGGQWLDEEPVDEHDNADETLLLTNAARSRELRILDDELALWLNDVGTPQVVAVLETCHSGGHRPSSAAEVASGLIDDLARRGGTERRADLDHTWQGVVMAACREAGTSRWLILYGAGIFTHHLTQGVQHRGADANGDYWTSAREAFAYARQQTLADVFTDQVPVAYYGSPDPILLFGPARDDNIDVRIRLPAEQSWTGDNIYNSTGQRQAANVSVVPGQKQAYQVSIQNDWGSRRQPTTVTGPSGPPAWEIKYYDAWRGGTDVTTKVTSNGWRVGWINPGEHVKMRVEVVPAPWVRAGARKTVQVSARSLSSGEADTVRAVAEVVTAQEARPDARVWDEGAWLGDNIYNAEGDHQSVRRAMVPGNRAAYRVSAQNDRDDSDRLRIAAPAGGDRWILRYLDGQGRDISATVTSSGWLTPELGPGESARIQVLVRARGSAAIGDTTRLSLRVGRARWNDLGFDQNADMVKLVTTVESGASTASCHVTSLSAAQTPAGAHITFALSATAQVHARIFNIAGRPVRTLSRVRHCGAGTNTLVWDAKSQSGLRVPNGVYLVEVTAKEADGGQTRALTQVQITW